MRKKITLHTADYKSEIPLPVGLQIRQNTKIAKDGIQLVSVTNHFKFQAPDGKQRFADALDSECVQTVAKNYPNNRARKFPTEP